MILQLKITWILLAVPGVALTILTLLDSIKLRRQQRKDGTNGTLKLTVDSEFEHDLYMMIAHSMCIVGVLMFLPRIDQLQESPQWWFIATRNTIFPAVSFFLGMMSLVRIRARNRMIDYIRSESGAETTSV